ncbi:MAG: amidohydrolase family protein [candidate division WS1 bacterium]|nr:amidohydrolase family protein [candidate division WS1 bacterium]
MINLDLFDANAVVGNVSDQRPEFPRATDLLAHMDRLGIGRALVWHAGGAGFQTIWGNEKLLADLAATPAAAGRLFPAFVISPNVYYERGSLDWLRSAMEQQSVRALRFSYARPEWSLDALEPVLEALLPLSPVLFLSARESLPKADLLALAARFPQMPLVITEAMWGHLGPLLDLMRQRANIYLETSWLHTHRGLELFIEHYGAERLLFGTGFRSHHGAAIAELALADLTAPQREALAHGNLERLLGLPASSAPALSSTLSPLWDRLLAREPLGCEVVDAHGHLGPMGSFVTQEQDLSVQTHRALAWMDRYGVSTMVISGDEALHADPVVGNRILEESLTPYGGRFRGYLAFNPWYAEVTEPLLDDCFSRPFWAGFKVLCDYWRVPLTDSRFTPAWEYAHAHCLPILIHTWGGGLNSPAMLSDLAPKYPHALFLLGHSGGSARGEAERLARDNPNVYLEWCGSFTVPDSWEDTLARVGADRIVFGTDAIPHSFVWELGRLLSQPFTEEQFRQILGANMRAILARRR